MALLDHAVLVASGEHVLLVRRATGLERVARTVECHRGRDDLRLRLQPLLKRRERRADHRQPEVEAVGGDGADGDGERGGGPLEGGVVVPPIRRLLLRAETLRPKTP